MGYNRTLLAEKCSNELAFTQNVSQDRETCGSFNLTLLSRPPAEVPVNRLPIPRGPTPPRLCARICVPAPIYGRLLASLVVVLGGPALWAAELPRARPPGKATGHSGTLVIVGGGQLPDSIRERFLELAGGRNAHLVIIPTASYKADLADLQPAMSFWKAQPVASVEMLHTRKPQEASSPEFLRCLKRATGIWLSGGDQNKLMSAYGGTELERELKRFLARGGVIGGTSAGASVMSPLMICGGYPHPEIGPGFGLLSGVIIDQHFSNRHRLVRLLNVLGRNPSYLGIGIDEQTALIVTGNTLSVIGNAEVRLCVAASGALPASIEVLKAGQRADLDRLYQSVMARIQPLEKERADARTGRERRVEAARGDR